jgi:hypothetical protein
VDHPTEGIHRTGLIRAPNDYRQFLLTFRVNDGNFLFHGHR